MAKEDNKEGIAEEDQKVFQLSIHSSVADEEMDKRVLNYLQKSKNYLEKDIRKISKCVECLDNNPSGLVLDWRIKRHENLPISYAVPLHKDTPEVSVGLIFNKLLGNKKKYDKRIIALHKRIMDDIDDMILITNKKGKILSVNQRAERSLGYDDFDDISLSEIMDKRGGRELKDFLSAGSLEFKSNTELYTSEGYPLKVELKSKKVDTDDSGLVFNIIKHRSKHEDRAEKEEFFGSLLRHDIQNKIQVIHGYICLLQDTNLTEEQTNYLEKFISVINECKELIETVGILKRIDENSLQNTDLDKVIIESVSGIERSLNETGIEVVYDENKLSVLAGPLINEVLANLLDNAIKHSGCSKIEISTERVNDKVIVKVEDDGKGILDDLKKHVFKKGTKGKISCGSGMGLYLSKKIVSSYGGEMTVTDSPMGGASFILSLKAA